MEAQAAASGDGGGGRQVRRPTRRPTRPRPAPAAGAAAAAAAAGAAKGVPPSQLPRLAGLVHSNSAGMAKIVDEFQAGTPEGTAVASRAQIEKAIRGMAERGKRPGAATGRAGSCTMAARGAGIQATPKINEREGGDFDGAVAVAVDHVLNPAMRLPRRRRRRAGGAGGGDGDAAADAAAAASCCR